MTRHLEWVGCGRGWAVRATGFAGGGPGAKVTTGGAGDVERAGVVGLAVTSKAAAPKVGVEAEARGAENSGVVGSWSGEGCEWGGRDGRRCGCESLFDCGW